MHEKLQKCASECTVKD